MTLNGGSDDDEILAIWCVWSGGGGGGDIEFCLEWIDFLCVDDVNKELVFKLLLDVFNLICWCCISCWWNW